MMFQDELNEKYSKTWPIENAVHYFQMHEPNFLKFYDFNEQVIDGEIKKPTALYTDSKKKVKFDRLLKLKRSFIPDLMKTAEERTFK